MEQTNKDSVAIYHIVKISNTHIKKKVQGEAKIAEMYIADIETKFEYALFSDSNEFSYLDLFIYFRAEWERMTKALERYKFKYIRINTKHFDNQYAPIQ